MPSFGLSLKLDRAITRKQGYLLDLQSVKASAAFSLRKLRKSYSGYCVSVRRSSDNAITDIGFNASGRLDTVALLAFIGSGSGYITTWYDQSGNNFHVTQSSNAAQPLIVSNGKITTDAKGNNTLKFISSYLLNTNASLSDITTINCVATSDNVATAPLYQARLIALADPSTTNVQFNISGTTVNGNTTIVGGQRYPNHIITGNAYGVGNPSVPIIITLSRYLNNGNQELYLNGSINGSNSTVKATNYTSYLSIGALVSNSGPLVQYGYWVGSINEIIIFSAPIITDYRKILEHNQEAYYSIGYPAI